MLLKPLILICLLCIAYQDMRYRAVYWLVFPVLSVLLFYEKQLYIGVNDTLNDSVYGSMFVGFQLFLLWAYFFIKYERPVNILQNHLGLGDVLFLLSITFYFSPVNFVLFYISSLIITLLYACTELYIFKRKELKIPLAGLQAIYFLLLLVLSVFYRDLKCYSDFWVWKLAHHLCI